MNNILVENILKKLSEDLYNHTVNIQVEGGIYSSDIGLAIFFGWYSIYTNEDKYLDKVYLIIEKLLNNIAQQESNSIAGVAGVGWGIQYLTEIGVLTKKEAGSYVDQIFSFVYNSLREDEDTNDYDLLDGYIGKVLFLMAFVNDNDHEFYNQLINRSLIFLESFIIKEGAGIKWSSSDFRDDTCYLGLAHGMAGIISFLTEVYKISILINHSVGVSKSKELIIAASTWLIDKERKGTNELLRFPITFPDSKEAHTSKFAWCHGDLGIALSLVKAGKVLQNEVILSNGIRITERISKIRIETSGVWQLNNYFDCSICHGIFGAYFSFAILDDFTSSNLTKKARQYWFSITIDYCTKHINDLFCGITNIEVGEDTSKLIRRKNKGLIIGISGCALMFLTDLIKSSGKKELTNILNKNPWFQILI
jgi:lantibiotic modifying enzyme